MFSTFYHGTLKKYVTLFGTLFNDIYINRVDATNDVINTIKIPLSYAPKEKVLARLEADPALERPIAIILPRMSFEITTMTYAATRKLPSINRSTRTGNDPTQLKYQYSPVPYDISFSLYIMVKNQEDGTQILEQILPYFTPEYTVTVDILPEMNHKIDVPTTLLNVTPQDSYEGNFQERRVITWTLDFIMKGYFYGPVRESKIINLANTNFFDASLFDNINNAVGNTEVVSNITIVPGLTANGLPASNTSLSVNKNEISANSNYGYITTRG